MTIMTRKTIVSTTIMTIAQILASIVILMLKYEAQRGSQLRVMVAYRLILATILYLPGLFVYERFIKTATPGNENNRPPLTWMVAGLAFLCGFFGVAVSQNLIVVGLLLSSATKIAAISNLFPAMTFIFALILRRENLNIHSWLWRSKLIGAIISVIGAMILALCSGIVLDFTPHELHAPEVTQIYHKGQESHALNYYDCFGILAAIGSCFFLALSNIIEGKLLERYPDSPRASGLILGIGAIQFTVYAAIMDQKMKYWHIDFTIKSTMMFYLAITSSGLMMIPNTWCIAENSSFFTTMFNPIALIIIAIVSPSMLNEDLHLGSLIGLIVIIIGFYLVIWGKKVDSNTSPQDEDEERA